MHISYWVKLDRSRKDIFIKEMHTEVTSQKVRRKEKYQESQGWTPPHSGARPQMNPRTETLYSDE